MENQWLALVFSFAMVFVIIGLAGIISKVAKLSEELSRKLVHIGVGNWIIPAMYLFKELPFLLITPLAFILINYLSLRFKLIKVMEQEEPSYGTVWYAVSLFLLALFGFVTSMKEVAIIGILVMAYGDGLAAVIGRKWGKRHFSVPFHRKSIEGSLALFIAAYVVSFLSFYFILGKVDLMGSFLIAFIAALVEIIPHMGGDNLLVPLVAGATTWFIGVENPSFDFYLAMLLAALILGFGFYRRSITYTGTLHGMAVAIVLYQFGGWMVFSALLIFFIVGSILSKVGKSKEEIERRVHKNQGARRWIQVYANAGAAVLMVVLGRWTGNSIYQDAAIIVFAAALADTASSEIGMLSKRAPVSILTFRPTQVGLSGGISFLGISAGLFFAFVMALLFVSRGVEMVLICTVFGILGSLLDSILGEAFQAKYASRIDGTWTEREDGSDNVLVPVKGHRLINNDVVNFVSTISVGFLYVWIWM